MGDNLRNGLTRAAKVLRLGALAALGLGGATFLFAFLAHGLSWSMGLDWSRKLLILVGALMLVVGGCGLFMSGRDRPDDEGHPHEDDGLRMFQQEMGMPWCVAVSVASLDFLVLGTVVDLLYISLSA